MIDPNKKEHAEINHSDVCYRAFELMKAKQFDDAERLIANNMAKSDDDAAVALYHSVLGVLNKMKGEFKAAWKHYERAEKLLPSDPALKIISARLLIDEFAEYDQAIKKAKKVLELLPDHPVFAHQAHVTMGLAFLKKGMKKKAMEALLVSMNGDFRGFVTAKNIDLHLVEALLVRGWGTEECGLFLKGALAFAKDNEEADAVKLFERLMNAYREEHPSISEETAP